MHMSYRSKTYTWNDVILVKRSMVRVFAVALQPNASHGLLILEVSRSHITTHHS